MKKKGTVSPKAPKAPKALTGEQRVSALETRVDAHTSALNALAKRIADMEAARPAPSCAPAPGLPISRNFVTSRFRKS